MTNTIIVLCFPAQTAMGESGPRTVVTTNPLVPLIHKECLVELFGVSKAHAEPNSKRSAPQNDRHYKPEPTPASADPARRGWPRPWAQLTP